MAEYDLQIDDDKYTLTLSTTITNLNFLKFKIMSAILKKPQQKIITITDKNTIEKIKPIVNENLKKAEKEANEYLEKAKEKNRIQLINPIVDKLVAKKENQKIEIQIIITGNVTYTAV
jgi:flagellar biosynthesis protein FliP